MRKDLWDCVSRKNFLSANRAFQYNASHHPEETEQRGRVARTGILTVWSIMSSLVDASRFDECSRPTRICVPGADAKVAECTDQGIERVYHVTTLRGTLVVTLCKRLIR